MLKYKIPQIVTLTQCFDMLIFAMHQKQKNPRKVLIYRDFLCFAILSSGETGSRTYTFTEYHKTAND